MRTSYRVAAALGLLFCAAPTPGQAPAPAPEKADGPRAVVLLLDSFRIVEGTFALDPRGNYVGSGGGGAPVFPAASVLFVGASRDDVAKYLAARAADTPPPKATPGDFNGVAAKTFPTKVQPVLSNLCANCHARSDYAGTFKLAPVPTGHADPAAARANLVAAFVHVDRAAPSASDLLAKCVTAHGGQKVPSLRDRTHPAYATLELWAHGMAQPDGTPVPTTVPPPKPQFPPAVFVSAKPAAPVAKKPTAPASADPFDPAEFNAVPKR